jgi:hypothetical protein
VIRIFCRLNLKSSSEAEIRMLEIIILSKNRARLNNGFFMRRSEFGQCKQISAVQRKLEARGEHVVQFMS